MKFTDILDRFGVSYRQEGQHHHARTGWVQMDCPFCGKGSGKFHLGYNLSGGFCNCWRCGSHQAEAVLIELSGESYRECRKLLESLPRSSRMRQDASKSKGSLQTPSGLEPLTGAHRRYLVGRGFDPDQISSLWGVQGIGLSAHLSWRIWIPIHHQGEVVSWTTRTIGKGVRYISAKPEQEKVPHKSLLYGSDYARHSIIICEGPTDVWRIGPGAVATLGVVYSRHQLRAMAAYPVRVVCFDNEKDARKRALELVTILDGYPGETKMIRVETAGDVAEADDEEVETIREMVLDCEDHNRLGEDQQYRNKE
jgi:hypothetical protein